MEALIASNQSNPLQQPQDKLNGSGDNSNGGAATTTTSVADAPINSRGSSSGQSSLVPPERRHSTSASDWSPNGSILKKNSIVSTVINEKTGGPVSNGSSLGHNRRHSLPNGNGCIVVPLKETPMGVNPTDCDPGGSPNNTNHSTNEEEEEEEISETAALTAV